MQTARQQTGPDQARPTRRLGKYEIISRIGHGGMAEVYLARMRGPMSFEKIVVVKTIHPELASQDEFLKMLFDEARLSALIRHPNVIDIYELGQANGEYFIAMEYLDGQALSLLIAAGAKGYPLDAGATARIIASAAGGLHAAHELRTTSGKLFELVHRDVSPGNIMVLYDGSVKIVDFGIAKARGRLTMSGARQLKGKIGYASPEQLTNQRVDRRSDVFSLGVVLWETLTHRRLFPGDELVSALERMRGGDIPPPSTYSPQVPPPLDAVCMRALQVEPDARFQTAAEMKEALEDVLRLIGSHRETDVIAQHMTRVFARRRDERSEMLKVRAPTGTEFAVTDEGAPVVPDVATPLEVKTNELSGQVMRPPTLAPARSRWKLATALLLLLGAGGGSALYWQWRSAGAEGPTARPARASARVSAAAPVPAPLEPSRAAEAPPAAVVTEGPPPGPTEPAAPAPTAERPPPAEPAAPAEPEEPEDPEPARPTRSAAALHREGADLFVQGKAEAAKQRFKEALAVNPRHAPSHRGLGLAYQALGKNDRAIAAFERYLRLSPDAADAPAIRGRIEKLRP